MYHKNRANNRIQLGKDLFVLGSLLVVMTVVAIGGDVSSDNFVGEIDVDAYSGEIDASANGKLKFIGFEKGKNIKDGLRVLAALYRKNIVPSSQVDGPLTISSLYDVTFEQALDAVLGNSYKYDQDGNFIRVYTVEEYKKIKTDKDRMRYKVFTLYYISAAEAKMLIMPVLSTVGTIQASSPVETIASTGESITTGTGGGDTMALNDHLVILDYPENLAEVEKMLKELDVRPKQVLVEATILSANLTEGMQLGVDLNLLNGVSLDGTDATSDITTTTTISRGAAGSTPVSQIAAGNITGAMLETSGFATVGGSGLRVGISSGDVAAFITALETTTDTTVLANPKIMAINKQLGQVYIGTKIGYISQTTQNQTSTTQQVEFLDTGTKLSFRPYIGDDGYIRMDIHPKDSSGTLKSNDIPDESSTELATNIMVKDGQTIVIGGLFRDVVVTSRRQIPLLGDLPLIGPAFRSTTDTVTRQEVIVLLTPHIINDPEEAEADSDARVDDIRRKRFGAQNELQWTSKARLAEECYALAVKYYFEGDTEAAMRNLMIVLELRPAYLEAIRLRERIIAETSPDEVDKLERIMMDDVDRLEAPNWLRR